MTRQRVYIDACILIAALGHKNPVIRTRAMDELGRDVDYLFSTIVELETVPQTVANNFVKQTAFLQKFFSRAERVPCTPEMQIEALRVACEGFGQSACDAMHIVCARTGGATELVTAEKPEATLPKAIAPRDWIRSIAL